MIRLNNSWEFTPQWSEEFLRFGGAATPVRLPHNAFELPLHYSDPDDYQLLCGYRRHFSAPLSWKGSRLILQFDGAAHIATVFVNGSAVIVHKCGYTAFRVDITRLVRFGEDNDLVVRLDTSENPTVPPFGFVVDYLTYGGIYRDVWLDVRPQNYLEDIFVTTPALDKAHIELKVSGDANGARIRIFDREGASVYELSGPGDTFDLTLHGAQPWTLEDPYLYRCEVTLLQPENIPTDTQSTSFGFRTAEFKTDGFYLNDEKVFLRGLNRHQSFPYLGYAAPEALQREDARLLKEELAVNAVRTSHYPQSQYFVDECDRQGLLVFTEIPGWQHIGDEAWKEQAIENTQEMILQYRNHPSVILWGVRINESLDDEDFYKRTNALAHKLDPTRATSGVRYIENSQLLEDVYSYNDFSHNGTTPPVRKKKDVMKKEPEKPLLISECNGHMFPTKTFDGWAHRQEHALRHARVQGGALADGEHAGCFGWCMFDYQTHKDFGAGDRICYHGVMDAFRNPKLAAAVYASQGNKPVLEVGSSFDIGDYPAGQIGDIYLFTNTDKVTLYKNGKLVTSFTPKPMTGLAHEPVLVDDTIGQLLESEEGFSKKKAKIVRECLLAAVKYGMANLPLKYKLKLGWCMVRHHLSFADGVRLYGTYASGWGGASTVWRFEGEIDGEVVAVQEKGPGQKLHLQATPSATYLVEGDCYDCAAVRLKVLDERDNVASYAQLPLILEVSGPIEIAGPNVVTAEGGMTGVYVRTTGEAGEAVLRVSSNETEPVEVRFHISGSRVG